MAAALYTERARAITERARAKVNLTLKVLGRRSDGFHELESLVAFAGIGDGITLDVMAPVGVSVCGPFGPSIAGENLVRVALDRLRLIGPQLQLGHVTLDKQLPIAAGIGGGSADAAAVLRAVRRANPDFANRIEWLELAANLGADVPVCFHSGPAMMRGTGDRLEPIETMPPLSIVLVNPKVPVPPDKTARVFRALAAQAIDPVLRKQTARPTFATRSELLAFMMATGNDLTAPAMQIVPEIRGVMEALSRTRGAEHVTLSGGGPTCFAVFADEAGAQDAASTLSATHPAWWVMATSLEV